MQVVNRKERANAKWRFAGLYILSVAIPALIIINSFDMGKVECKENEQLVEQLRKRDQALAELSKLAVTLQAAQKLKPAYANEPEDQARYDQLRYNFEKGVENMKKLYYSDTTLYRNNYNLVAFMESNHREHNRVGNEFRAKVDEEVSMKVATLPREPNGGGGSGNQAELMVLQVKLQNAQSQISDLKERLAGTGKTYTGQLEDMRSKATSIDMNIDRINRVLTEIEQDCSGIEKRSNRNVQIKNNILEKVKILKNQMASIKDTSSNLVGMTD